MKHINKLIGALVLLSALVLFDRVFRPEIEIAKEVEVVVEEVITPIKKRHQFEICRDKLYTKYPRNIDSKKWRECMSETK